MPKILKVEANNDHTLLIALSNSHKIICDLKPRLQTVRFRALADLERFKDVRLEHGNTLVWDSLCQLTIDEIIGLVSR